MMHMTGLLHRVSYYIFMVHDVHMFQCLWMAVSYYLLSVCLLFVTSSII